MQDFDLQIQRLKPSLEGVLVVGMLGDFAIRVLRESSAFSTSISMHSVASLGVPGPNSQQTVEEKVGQTC